MDQSEFAQMWSAIYGLPAWSVRKGHGSFLTMEFGLPELFIREPIIASSGASETVRLHLARRRVHIHGAWHLWIYCCNWMISDKGAKLAENESPDVEIDAAAERIDGQKLLSVSPGKASGSWIFRFDLGAELMTWPYGCDAEDEQWMLYVQATGKVLTARANNLVSYVDGNQSSSDRV